MFVRRASATIILSLIATPAIAQENFSIELTEEEEPSNKAWEDPANFSIEIDPDGKDRINIAANLEAKALLSPTKGGLEKSLGGYLRWAKDNKKNKEKDAFEAGLVFDIDDGLINAMDRPNTPADLKTSEVEYLSRVVSGSITDTSGNLTNQALSELVKLRQKKLYFDHKISLGYARKVTFPELEKSPCKDTPALAQCSDQVSESIRASYLTSPFKVDWEDSNSCLGQKMACQISPKFGIDYDHLFNSPINPDTGIVQKGGYLSGLAGIAVLIAPNFINPDVEIKGSFDMRRKIHASNTRNPTIESWAEQVEVSATYYVLKPRENAKKGWRAGIGVTYSNGHNPLKANKDEEKVLISFKLGRY